MEPGLGEELRTTDEGGAWLESWLLVNFKLVAVSETRQSFWPAFCPFVNAGDSNENKPLVGAEEEEVAKMGCPSLGEHMQLEVIIEESYEFKVSVCVCFHR